MIIKSDLIAESPPMPVRPRSVLTRQPDPQTASSGLDEHVVILIIGLAIVACGGLIAASHGLVATASAEPARIATLLVLTLVLQMFSVRVYGRGSVSVSAIGSSRAPSCSTSDDDGDRSSCGDRSVGP